MTRPSSPRAPCVEGILRTGAPHSAPGSWYYSDDDTTRGRSSRVPCGGPPGPIRDTRAQMVKLSASPTPPRLCSTGCALFSCVCMSGAARLTAVSRPFTLGRADRSRATSRSPSVCPIGGVLSRKQPHRQGVLVVAGWRGRQGSRRLKPRLWGVPPRSPPARTRLRCLAPAVLYTNSRATAAIPRLILHQAARSR